MVIFFMSQARGNTKINLSGCANCVLRRIHRVLKHLASPSHLNAAAPVFATPMMVNCDAITELWNVSVASCLLCHVLVELWNAGGCDDLAVDAHHKALGAHSNHSGIVSPALVIYVMFKLTKHMPKMIFKLSHAGNAIVL